jgi:hypothetical protein
VPGELVLLPLYKDASRGFSRWGREKLDWVSHESLDYSLDLPRLCYFSFLFEPSHKPEHTLQLTRKSVTPECDCVLVT